MGRLLAIGDIHGCRDALDSLLTLVNPQAEDTLIVLGDFIDRGPDSKGVIERMIRLSDSIELIPIRGNHEIMMMQARESRASAMEWSGFGGDATLESYSVDQLSDIPSTHWQFIEETRPFYETERYFFVHAKSYADVWLSKQPDRESFREVFGEPPPDFQCRGKTFVFGHTPQRDGRPNHKGNSICLDTGVHAGGWLTCLDVHSMEYWQTNGRGESRSDTLHIP